MDNCAGFDRRRFVHGLLLGDRGSQLLSRRPETPTGVVEPLADGAGRDAQQLGELRVGPVAGVTQDEEPAVLGPEPPAMLAAPPSPAPPVVAPTRARRRQRAGRWRGQEAAGAGGAGGAV